VLVGIPSDAEQPHLGAGVTGTEARSGVPIGNAALGYIHENGSPINNIPARPWLAPGVRGSQTQWMPYFEQAGKFAFEGNLTAMDKALNAVGLTAQSAVKVRITEGIPPPLAERTVKARQRKRPSRKAQSAEDMTPLIDTAQFLGSISYVVRKGK
jgi:hypothetical protein